jgi:hypothetical protein
MHAISVLVKQKLLIAKIRALYDPKQEVEK